MIKLDWNPSAKKLREFGFFALAGFGLLGALVAWRLNAFAGSGSWFWPVVLWSLAVVCPLLGLLAPHLLKPLFVGLTLLAFPIGWVVGMVVMGILYFGIFTPLAAYFRLIKRDELRLRERPEAESFWIKSPETPPPAASYYRQS
jgi:hypothetical protein